MKDPLVLCILGAFALDLVLGDPRWMPHPVRLIGRTAVILEWLLTRVFGRNRFSGILFTLLIAGGAYFGTWGLLWGAGRIDPRLAVGVCVYLLYTAFAARDLDVESTRVWKALEAGDLPRARQDLSMIVGRETAELDEPEITRAAVETVAENTTDGVLAPLFFAVIGGAPLAIAYKAINTLDSMVGHRTPRYLKFGWASARLDDVANYIPARIGGVLLTIASFLARLDAAACWRMILRDAAKSPSPNAGIPEAAVAGALGVRLGGMNIYQGQRLFRPYLGDPIRPLERYDIRRAVKLMYVASLLMLVLGVATRELLVRTEPWKLLS